VKKLGNHGLLTINGISPVPVCDSIPVGGGGGESLADFWLHINIKHFCYSYNNLLITSTYSFMIKQIIIPKKKRLLLLDFENDSGLLEQNGILFLLVTL